MFILKFSAWICKTKSFVLWLSGPHGTSNFDCQSLIYSDLNYTNRDGIKDVDILRAYYLYLLTFKKALQLAMLLYMINHSFSYIVGRDY